MKPERWNPTIIPHAPAHWHKPRLVKVSIDLFTLKQWQIHDVLAAVKLRHQHTFEVVTEHPDVAAKMEWQCAAHQADFRNLLNLRLGTTIRDQAEANAKLPPLLSCPAVFRFVDVVPREAIDLTNIRYGDYVTDALAGRTYYLPTGDGGMEQAIDWVICGGESGPGERPCNVWWIRSIRDQCRAANVPVFIKQVGSKPYEYACNGLAVRSWGDAKIQRNGDFIQIHLRDGKGGDPSEWPIDLRVREMPQTRREETR